MLYSLIDNQYLAGNQLECLVIITAIIININFGQCKVSTLDLGRYCLTKHHLHIVFVRVCLSGDITCILMCRSDQVFTSHGLHTGKIPLTRSGLRSDANINEAVLYTQHAQSSLYPCHPVSSRVWVAMCW